jgi:hypothetical protein
MVLHPKYSRRLIFPSLPVLAQAKLPFAAVEWPLFSGLRLVPRQAIKHQDRCRDDQ